MNGPGRRGERARTRQVIGGVEIVDGEGVVHPLAAKEEGLRHCGAETPGERRCRAGDAQRGAVAVTATHLVERHANDGRSHDAVPRII